MAQPKKKTDEVKKYEPTLESQYELNAQDLALQKKLNKDMETN